MLSKDRIGHLLTHKQRLIAYVRARISSAELAEDLVQDSLLKALRGLDSLHDDERLLPWFYTILNNAITDAYRRSAVASRQTTSFDPTAYDPPVPEAEDEQALCECFLPLLDSLRPEEARLIRSMDLGTDRPAQVAERLGITSNALKVRRHRARQALRKRLEETCRTCATHGCMDCTCHKSFPYNEIGPL